MPILTRLFDNADQANPKPVRIVNHGDGTASLVVSGRPWWLDGGQRQTILPEVLTLEGDDGSIAAGALWIDCKATGGPATVQGVPIADGESYSLPPVADCEYGQLNCTVPTGTTLTVVCGRVQ